MIRYKKKPTINPASAKRALLGESGFIGEDGESITLNM